MDSNQIIIDFLQMKFPVLQGIYLFGSRADGSHQKDSDYDIGILLPYDLKISSLDKFELATDLAAQLGQDVDLLDLRALYTDVQFEVIANGERIFCADKYACDSFEMITISQFQRHKESIKSIVEDVKKRGYVYERNRN